MKNSLAKKLTIGVISIGVIGTCGYLATSDNVKNTFSSNGSSNSNGRDSQGTTQALYKEETVSVGNIVVGVTEAGTTSLANTSVNYDVDIDISNVAVKTGQYVNEGDFIANAVLTDADDVYDAYLDEREKYQDLIDNYNDQITSYEKQIKNYEDLYVDYEEQYDDYLDDLENAWKDHQKTLIDTELSKSDALKKLEENLSLTSTLQTSYNLEQEEQKLTIAKMERDLQLLYDAHQELVDELKEGYDSATMIQEAQDNITSVKAEITQVEKEIAHAYVCERTYYTYEWEGCSQLSYEHDLTKLATEQVSLENELSVARAKLTEVKENAVELEAEWTASMQSSIDKALISIEDKEISVKEYELSLTSKAISTADNYKDAEYTETNAQAIYDSTILQIESTVTSSEAKIKSVESSLTKTQKSMADVLEDIDEVYANIESTKKDISEARSDMYKVSLDTVDKEIFSPKSGYVVTISNEGTIKSGTDIVSVGDAIEVALLVSISQDDIRDIYIGMENNIVFDAYPDYTFRAEVDTISMSPASGMQTTVNYTVTILCDVSQFPDAVIYGGMTGDITFIQREKTDVLVISNKCVFTDDAGKEYVKIKNNVGEIETIPITTGFSDGFDVEIISGLKEGDIVIIESAVNI